jgi:hypothetical protein
MVTTYRTGFAPCPFDAIERPPLRLYYVGVRSASTSLPQAASRLDLKAACADAGAVGRLAKMNDAVLAKADHLALAADRAGASALVSVRVGLARDGGRRRTIEPAFLAWRTFALRGANVRARR